MCFQWSREERTGAFGVPGAQFDEEFDEVLFSILAVDEQIPYLNRRTLVPCFRWLEKITAECIMPADFKSPENPVSL
jgi:hypothetical protein